MNLSKLGIKKPKLSVKKSSASAKYPMIKAALASKMANC